MNLEASLVTTVNLGQRSYPIYVGKGLIEHLRTIVEETLHDISKLIVITSPIIKQLYWSKLNKVIKELNPILLIVPDGEEAKTWDWASKLIGKFIDRGLDRKGIVIAFGGGAIGDLVGFTSSIYLRGIKVVQVPTTLLGMVDSSIGGKTAVNHEMGKNLIGSFYQPSLVVSDPIFLKTLSIREIRSGLCEVVKYGVIHDLLLFNEVEKNSEKLLKTDLDPFTNIIKKCSLIKAWYVEHDERDMNELRTALNYGHTVGHAIEKLTNHSVRHGEAVAIGMDLAARVAKRLKICNASLVNKQRKLLNKLGIGTEIIGFESRDIIEVMRRDKKSELGMIKMVLPTEIGKPPLLKIVSEELLMKILGEKD